MDGLFELLPYIIAIIIFLVRIFGGRDKQIEENQPAPAKETIPQKAQPKQNKSNQNSLDDLLKQVKKQLQEAEKEAQKHSQKPQPQRQKKVLDVVQPEKGLSEEQRKGDQHFTPYQIQQKKQSPFAKILKNKDTLKQAIIVSEILNRKYF